MLEEVVKKNEEMIKHDTLSVKVVYEDATKNATETNINGETLFIDVEKI